MKQTYMPCIDCAYGLQAKHPLLENVWTHLTAGMTLDDPYIIIEDDDLGSVYKTLEEMCFIVTHEESPGTFIIKILGFREGSQLICIHRHIT